MREAGRQNGFSFAVSYHTKSTSLGEIEKKHPRWFQNTRPDSSQQVLDSKKLRSLQSLKDAIHSTKDFESTQSTAVSSRSQERNTGDSEVGHHRPPRKKAVTIQENPLLNQHIVWPLSCGRVNGGYLWQRPDLACATESASSAQEEEAHVCNNRFGIEHLRSKQRRALKYMLRFSPDIDPESYP